MKSLIRRTINAALRPTGFELVRSAGNAATGELHFAMPNCTSRIAHAASLGFQPRDIIDAGAFAGDWTTEVNNIYPTSRFLVIEPNPATQARIRETLQPLGTRATIIQKAVADQTGTMTFNIWGDPNEATSASLQNHVRGEADQRFDVDVTTLDDLITEHGFQPGLIKLDLQGAELRALRGATEALKTTEMFIVEFGCLQAYIDRTTPCELFEVFYANDYCLYDIVDCHYRPFDGALTGGDFFFVKNSSPLKAYVDYD